MEFGTRKHTSHQPSLEVTTRDGTLGASLGHSQVSDLTGASVGVGTILHPCVAPAPDPHRDRFGREFSFAPTGDPTGAQKKPNNIFHPSPQRPRPARSPS
jgi:hypothetical protein